MVNHCYGYFGYTSQKHTHPMLKNFFNGTAMQNNYCHKTVIVLIIVTSYLSAVTYLIGAEKKEIKINAEKFVCQICNKKLNDKVQSYNSTFANSH
jgi:hypothetical protein